MRKLYAQRAEPGGNGAGFHGILSQRPPIKPRAKMREMYAQRAETGGNGAGFHGMLSQRPPIKTRAKCAKCMPSERERCGIPDIRRYLHEVPSQRPSVSKGIRAQISKGARAKASHSAFAQKYRTGDAQRARARARTPPSLVPARLAALGPEEIRPSPLRRRTVRVFPIAGGAIWCLQSS